MSWYREVYLKSKDWANFRAAAIAIWAPDGRCLCCLRKTSLDVHHVWYRNLYDVNIRDLLPLCRLCHKKVHELLKLLSLENKPHPRRLWHQFIKPRLFGKATFRRQLFDLKTALVEWQLRPRKELQKRIVKRWGRNKSKKFTFLLDKTFGACTVE